MQTRRRELGGTHVASVCLFIGANSAQRYSRAASTWPTFDAEFGRRVAAMVIGIAAGQ
jgi:hypothetical protein